MTDKKEEKDTENGSSVKEENEDVPPTEGQNNSSALEPECILVEKNNSEATGNETTPERKEGNDEKKGEQFESKELVKKRTRKSARLKKKVRIAYILEILSFF